MSSRAAVLAFVTVLAVMAAGCGRSGETPDRFVVGAVEDSAKNGPADAKMLLARQAGYRAIVLSAIWTPPLEAPPGTELLTQCSFQIAFHEPPLGAVHGGTAHRHGAGNLFVATAGIGCQQDLCALELAGGRSTLL